MTSHKLPSLIRIFETVRLATTISESVALGISSNFSLSQNPRTNLSFFEFSFVVTEPDEFYFIRPLLGSILINDPRSIGETMRFVDDFEIDAGILIANGAGRRCPDMTFEIR